MTNCGRSKSRRVSRLGRVCNAFVNATSGWMVIGTRQQILAGHTFVMCGYCWFGRVTRCKRAPAERHKRYCWYGQGTRCKRAPAEDGWLLAHASRYCRTHVCNVRLLLVWSGHALQTRASGYELLIPLRGTNMTNCGRSKSRRVSRLGRVLQRVRKCYIRIDGYWHTPADIGRTHVCNVRLLLVWSGHALKTRASGLVPKRDSACPLRC